MSTRFITGILALIFLALGIAALANPLSVMELLGFSTTPVQPLVLGEVRGIYGGMFCAMGLFTLFAATNPGGNRGALLLLAVLWFGICAGRLTGVYFDGDPGLRGWIAGGCELAVAVTIAIISAVAKPRAEKKRAEPTHPLAGPTEL